MPNLIPLIDTFDIYSKDITTFYNFNEIKINKLEFKLKYASGCFNSENSYFYLLTDKNDIHLALLRLVETNISGYIYHKIKKSYAVIQYKGYGEILYENCLKHHTTAIVSDNINTLPGSFNLWKKLINKNFIDVYRFDITNNRRRKIELPLNEFLIWGVETEFLETILETPWSAVNFTDDGIEGEDDSDNEKFVNYLYENDKIQRTILSNFIVDALRNKKRIKNRSNILLLIKNSHCH